MDYLWAMFGGAIGATIRFWFAAAMTALTGPAFPWGTLIINVLGSFSIGLLGAYAQAGAFPHISKEIAVFTMVGICGGFTTFSSFSLQTLDLIRGGRISHACGYVVSSVLLCLIFVWLGGRL